MTTDEPRVLFAGKRRVGRPKGTGRPRPKNPEPAAFAALRLIRPKKLAALFDVNQSTLIRWRKQGLLPKPVEIGGVIGWTEEVLREFLKRR
jgi:predicted DNA-binding transcriptional regulator AlpA